MEIINSSNHIEIVFSNRVAYFTLNHPPLNILTIKIMKEINETLISLGKKTPREVCAIVFRAAKGSTVFSAGTSIEEHRPELAYQMINEFHNIYRNLNFLSKPVISVVENQAIGGGCELAIYSDIIIASPSAKFTQPEIRLGVFPPMASILLPRIIGMRRATQMILMGGGLDAQEAKLAGLVNYIFPEETIEAKTEELLNVFRSYSGSVLEETRRALHTSVYFNVEEIMNKLEDQYLNQLMTLNDSAEGLEAFLKKRKPIWQHK